VTLTIKLDLDSVMMN